jgi:hypothetical protein
MRNNLCRTRWAVSSASVGIFGLELGDSCGRVDSASSVVDMMVVIYLDDHGASIGADA